MKPTRAQRRAARLRRLGALSTAARLTARRAARLAWRLNDSFVMRTMELRGAR